MANVYKNQISNFTSKDEFKEVAAKTLNEIYGRVSPFDTIDFYFNDQTGEATAVGYRDSEPTPTDDEIKNLSGGVAETIAKATANIADDMLAAEKEALAAAARIADLVRQGYALSADDQAIATTLGEKYFKGLDEEMGKRLTAIAEFYDGIVQPDGPAAENDLIKLKVVRVVDNQPADVIISGTLPEIEAKMATGEKPTYTIEDVLKASDAAMAFAEEHKLDLKLVTGTGKDGNITKGDVEKFLKANQAPAKDNANENGTQQPDA